MATKNILKKNTMLIALGVVMVLFQVLIVRGDKGSLFAPNNISNLFFQNSYVVILAAGMLLCILTGGNIDLSVGSVVAFVGAMAGTLIVTKGVNIYLSIVICLLLGAAIGAWQGFWIAYMRIPAFIVTLAGMLVWRGLALVTLGGLTISPFPEEYTRYFNTFIPGADASKATVFRTTMLVAVSVCVLAIALQVFSRIQKKRKGYAAESIFLFLFKLLFLCAVVVAIAWLLGLHKGIPVILILLAIVVFIYIYYTTSTVPGRHLYAMGGNEKAAQLSGINTNRVLFGAYTNMGFLSSLAALVVVSRFNSAAPTAGTNYEMDAIASCYIGGASAYGGTGTVGGAVIGAIFMGVLNNGMSILGIDSNWQRFVKGMVLLVAVAFDVISKKRSKAV
ncbi:MAG: sugar ABC transporter permease [Christensenellaceae bacterium]|jgi:putative multiple sugar transport system permease protein|nr:sugar ABC transporter permease [Christensenellaceae bacterium]